jgi:hypothetical protein
MMSAITRSPRADIGGFGNVESVRVSAVLLVLCDGVCGFTQAAGASTCAPKTMRHMLDQNQVSEANETTGSLWFRITLTVKGIHAATEHPITLDYPDSEPINIEFRQFLGTEDFLDDYAGSSQNLYDCIGTAMMRHKLSRNMSEWLLGDYVSLIKDDDESFSFDAIPKHLRQALQQVLTDIYATLRGALSATYCIFRWQHGLNEATPLSRDRFEWSSDGSQWTSPPWLRPLFVDLEMRDLAISSDIALEAARLLGDGVREPVAHELFWEAWHQRFQNPRSALVIGMAAAEIGFKEFVAGRVPKAAWLVTETPTPDLLKMLTLFLPGLLDSGGTSSRLRLIQGKEKGKFRDTVLDDLQMGVTLRNRVVHQPGAPPKPEHVDRALRAVRDLLYLLDYYAGNARAEQNIRAAVRKEWGSE